FVCGSHCLTAILDSAEAIVERPIIPGYQSPWDQFSVLSNYIQHFFGRLSAGPYNFTNPDYSIQMLQNGWVYRPAYQAIRCIAPHPLGIRAALVGEPAETPNCPS